MLCGAEPAKAALIGEQVFIDVVSGNLACVRTIFVEPRTTRCLWYTQIFRAFGRLIGARREGGGSQSEGAPDQRRAASDGSGGGDVQTVSNRTEARC